MVINGAVEEEHTDDDESEKEQPYLPMLDESSQATESFCELNDS